jgi:hypothetical protein
VKNRLDVIGQVEILESDPKDSNIYRRWAGIGEQATPRTQAAQSSSPDRQG